jgi:WD40 repeat protein/serine/threonine protein kinase
MSTEDRLAELLCRWEATRVEGQVLTPEELCRDCPELLDPLRRHIAQMQRFEQHFGVEETRSPSQIEPGACSGLEESLPATLAQPGTRFREQHLHARGGLGEVYLADDRELKRPVALKRIRAHLAGHPDSQRRFRLEAEVTGRLEHPGVVPVYGLGSDANGCLYYAMRFIKGQTLEEAIQLFHQADQLPRDPGKRNEALRELLGQFVAVCNTIAYAHSRGILHRDLKPLNVMLGAYGETLVVDWGLAKPFTRGEREKEQYPEEATLRPESDSGGTVGVMGTLAFMSPEQASGHWSVVGPASDVYSLGAILYVLLTGQRPVEGKDHDEVLEKVHHGEIVPLRERKKDVPRALEAICCKAMARKREERYQGALELADDVKRWLADEPVQAWPEPLLVRTRRWMSRRRTLVASTVAALVVATAALALSAALLSRANVAERRARAAAEQSEAAALLARARAEASEKEAVREGKEAERQRQRAERGEQEIRRRFYASQIRLGEQMWEKCEVLNLKRLLQALLPEPKQEDLRGFEWYYLRKLAYSQGEFTLGGEGVSVNALAVSPDGLLLAAAAGNTMALPGQPRSRTGEVKVWELPARRVRFSLRGHGGAVTAVAFAPDGQALATGSADRTVRLWDLTGKQTAILTEHPTAITALVYSPDGKWLATAGNAPRVFLREAATGKVVRSVELAIDAANLPSDDSMRRHLAFTPDSRSLAVTNGTGAIHFWDLTADKTCLIPVSDTSVSMLTFSPDGNTLAVNGNTGKVNLIDVRAGEVRTSLEGHTRSVMALAFSPEGGTLATGGFDESVRLWDVRTGREQAALKGLVSEVRDVVFSPTAPLLLIACRDGNVIAWDSSSSSACTIAQGDGVVIRSLAFLPQSEEVVVVSGERYTGKRPGEIKVWPTNGGMPSRALQGTARHVTKVAIAPDGRTLAVSFGHLERLQAGGEVGFYDLATGARKHVLHEPTGAVVGTIYSPDRKRLAILIVSGRPDTGAIRTRVKLLDAAGMTEQKTSFVVKGFVVALAFSPDGRQLVTGTINPRDPDHPSAVQVWEADTGRLLRALANRFEHVTRIALSPDGARLVTSERPAPGEKGDVMRLWDVESGKPLRALDLRTAPGSSVAFSPDGRSLAIATAGGLVHVFSRADGALRYTVQDSLEITAVAFSPDGKYLATGGADTDRAGARSASVRLWDAGTGKRAATFKGYAGVHPESLVFSPDSKTLVTQSEEGSVAVWAVVQARQKYLVLGQDLPALQGHMQPIISLVAAPDGKTLYTGGRDKLIKVWDLATGRVRATLSGHTEPVAVLALSPNGKVLASGSGGPEDRLGRRSWRSQPGELILWDAGTLTPLKTAPLKPGWVGGLAFTADGKSLAVGIGADARPTVRFWDLATLTEQTDRSITLREGAGVDALALDRAGARLAVATRPEVGVGFMTVAILDPATGKPIVTLKGHTNQILAVAFSPDGRTIATSSKDGLIKLWQASSGEELLTLRGHSNWVNGLAFSPQGDVLATGGRSGQGRHGELRFWNAPVTLQRVVYHDERTGCARSVDRYNDRSSLAETRILDKDSRLVVPPALGFARRVFAYDAQGNLTDVSCFDAGGNPLVSRLVVRSVVPEGQGWRLGIRPGDVLLTFNGRPIHNAAQFLSMRRTREEGDLVLEREGVRRTVRLQAGLIGCHLRDDLSASGPAPRRATEEVPANEHRPP